MNLQKALEVLDKEGTFREILTAFAEPHEAIREFHVGDAVEVKSRGGERWVGHVTGFGCTTGWPFVCNCGDNSGNCRREDKSYLYCHQRLKVIERAPPLPFHVGNRVRVKGNTPSGRITGFRDDGWIKVCWCGECSSSVFAHPAYDPADLEVIQQAPLTPPPFKFEVGDFVRVVNNLRLAKLHQRVGTVKAVNLRPSDSTPVTVEFPELIEDGHSCGGGTAPLHGRWLAIDELELIDRPRG